MAFLLLPLLCLAALGQALGCADIAPKWTPKLAPGVSAKVLANDLARPRGVVVDPKGNILVVESGGKGIRRIVLDGGEGLEACVESSQQLVNEESLNHGIQLTQDGKTLLASSQKTVYAFDYDAEQGTAENQRAIVNGMDQTDHQTRTLLVPGQNPDLLLVSRGSNSNLDGGTELANSGRSQIRIFNLTKLIDANASAVDFLDGQLFGWGLRNSVGLTQDPTTGFIWSVENSLDNMVRAQAGDIHNSNPGEELNFHGRPNETDNLFFGKNYGYPACVAIYDSSTVTDYPGGARTGMQMISDPSFDFLDDKWCQLATVAPVVTFTPHIAPLDIKFFPDATVLLMTSHGSWNRSPPDGYRLSAVVFENHFPLEDPSSQTAERPIMWNDDDALCPDECFRPACIAYDPLGRLFMTSDESGEMFMVSLDKNLNLTQARARGH